MGLVGLATASHAQDNRPVCDETGNLPQPKRGQAFEVRLSAAMTFLEHERDRERSLTGRGLAIGTAATAALVLVSKTLAGIVELPASELGHVALMTNAAAVVGLAGATVLVAVFGVLKPALRASVADAMLDRWLTDARLRDSEVTARDELLKAAIEMIKSVRRVNKKKARALTFAYWLFAAEMLLAAVAVATLGFS